MKTSAVSFRSKQKGVTLFELIISSIILGIVSWIAAANMGSFLAAKQQTFNAEQTVINRKIAQAMMDWSEYSDQATSSGSVVRGTLPPLCSGWGAEMYQSILVDGLCNDTLGQYLIAAGVDTASVHFANPLDQRLRIYQTLRPSLGTPSITVGLMGSYGASVQLNYDIGVIYTTNCLPSEACYTTQEGQLDLGLGEPAGAVPDTILHIESPSGGVSRLMPWTPPKVGAAGITYVSTLPLQKKLLSVTVERINRIRSALQSYFLTKQASEPAATKYTKNQYPNDGTTPTTSNPSPTTPDAGCRRGWISLSSTDSKVLETIGISSSVDTVLNAEAVYREGVTGWGGDIQYCSDFDPGAQTALDAPPHIAALRIHSSVTLGNPPSGTATDNTYIIF